MVAWSIATFASMPEIAELVVVTEPESLEPMRELCLRHAPARAARVVRGGATRQQSVRHGVEAVDPACSAVLVHDGARPLVRAADVRVAMAQVGERRAALLAVPVVDTIKVVDRDSKIVVETLERGRLWAAQTPQLALRVELIAAHESGLRDRVEATDDAALLERIGVEVVAVASSPENFKVTLPEDLARAQAILEMRAAAAAR